MPPLTNIWTLAYDNGTTVLEKALSDWGFDMDHSKAEFSNMATDVLTLAMPVADITADPVIPFEGRVTLWKGRTGSGTSWSGGTIEFQGKRLLHILDGQPAFEGVHYQFGGPWYDIDQTPYLQEVNTYDASAPGGIGTQFESEVVLFQSVLFPTTTTGKINTGQQIRAVLQSLLDQYAAQGLPAPLAIGTVDPAVNVPTYQVKDIKCSEAIQNCMRTSPDAKVFFDYTTVPPTCNVRSRANCAAVTLALSGGTPPVQSIKLTPRYDLQATSVTIIFVQQNSVNGQAFNYFFFQQCDSGGYAESIYSPSKRIGGLRSIVQTVEIAGFSQTVVQAHLDVLAVAATAAFWKKVVPELSGPRIRNLTISGSVLATDENGNAVNLANFPNMVLASSSGVAQWMKIGSTQVNATVATIKVNASYDQYDADVAGNLQHQFKGKELSVRAVLTNGVTNDYSTVTSETIAEPLPPLMAQSIFNALNALQYDGTVVILESEISGAVGIANVLNVSGGRSEWATMNAMIQRVSREYGSGTTEATVGPVNHLSAGDLTQMFLINRFRQVWRDPAQQGTSHAGAGSSVNLQNNVAKENSNAGVPQQSVQTLASIVNGQAGGYIVKDTTGQVVPGATAGFPILTMESRTGAGAQDPAKGVITLDTFNCKGSDGQYHKVYVREIDFCVNVGGTLVNKKAICVISDPY